MPSIKALAAKRATITAATAGALPDSTMTILVAELATIEQAMIDAPVTNQADLAIKAALLAELLSDPHGADLAIPDLVARLAADLRNIEAEQAREEERERRRGYRLAA